MAGKRAGLKHEANGDDETTRSGLFMEAVRIIKEMRSATNGVHPRFAVWENVPGAFSSNGGEDFRIVLEELIKIAEPTAVMPSVPKSGWAYADSYCGDGWSIAYRVLDAQFWGVPQRRRRIYLVADFRGERAGEILFEREGLRGYFETGGTPWQTVTGAAETGFGTADSERKSAVNAEITDGTISPCLTARAGTGGKGALIQSNKSATLATNDDQYLFQPIGIMDSIGGQVERGWIGESAPCLKASHYKFAPVVAIPIENHPADSRVNLDESGKCQTLTSRMGTGGGNVPMVLEPRSYSVGNGQLNRISMAQQANTLDCMHDQQAVLTPCQHTVGALCARNYKGVGSQYVDEGKVIVEDRFVRYIVRCLTPTECARLQGFPDTWGHPDKKTELTDEEYQFWLNVRNTHAVINDKATKEYTKDQILKWYNGLHTDSSEYKMWGNGIALPNAQYVMQGVADVLSKERSDLSKWLDELLGDCL